jgi:uncharacterized membrane protein
MKLGVAILLLISFINFFKLLFFDGYKGGKVLVHSNMQTIFLQICLVVFLLVIYKRLSWKEKYSKCPRCKTAYDYQKLDKGLCPKCHIPTIDMDEYFKQFPDELKDKKESKGA